MLSRLRRTDDGFTLVELLIAIVILAVITVPLADAVIGVLHNQDETEDRLALSHDAQIAASYFAKDVAAVGIRNPDLINTGGMHFQSIWRGAAHDAGGQQCGPGAVAQDVRLMSDNWDAPDSVTTHVVAYYLKPGTTELHRVKCTGSAPPFDVVVAHHVDPNTAVTVECSSTCEDTPPPRQVKLMFTVTLPSVDPYEITLVGERRQT